MALPNITALGGTFIYATRSIPILAGQVAQIADIATGGIFGLSDLIGSSPVKWGVFNLQGQEIAVCDSVLSVEFSNTARVSNYPVEEGAFAAYNKVADPFLFRVTLARGGSESERADFIKALDDAMWSLDLFNVLLPETSYFNVNVEGVSWRRTTGGGVGMVVAELQLVEVRETVTTEYSSPLSPDAEDIRQQGQLQPAPPDVSEAALIKAGSFA